MERTRKKSFLLLIFSVASFGVPDLVAMKRKRSTKYEKHLAREAKRRKLEEKRGLPRLEESFMPSDNLYYEMLQDFMQIGGDVNVRSFYVDIPDNPENPQNITVEEVSFFCKRTFLHNAVIDGRWDIVVGLLRHQNGVNIMARDGYNMAPWQYAHKFYDANNDVRKKIWDVLKFFTKIMFSLRKNRLVSNKLKGNGVVLTDNLFKEHFEKTLASRVGLHVRDNNLFTMLHYACYYGRSYIVQKLLDLGHGINLKESQGRTPLHIAVQLGHLAVVQLLLSCHGIDREVQDDFRKTPLDYARDAKNWDIAKALRAGR